MLARLSTFHRIIPVREKGKRRGEREKDLEEGREI